MKKSLTILLSVAALQLAAQNPIKVNQVGYYPQCEKTAAIEEAAFADNYTLTDAKGNTVWQGPATRTATSPWSGKKRAIVDFSTVTTIGEYTLSNGREKQSVTIRPQALSDLAIAAMHSFYLQRTGEPILAEHAGIYARPAAHPDTNVEIHPSAASVTRPAGTTFNSPGGWYDAGDFNKYIVNSAFTIALMLDAYEMNRDYFNAMNLNIPANSNGLPDFLEEILVNLRWMLTMQDPSDGGVYHKLTTPNFEGFVMPTECKQKRYVVAKTTAATLDFAAVMAKAARIYNNYPEMQELAKQMIRQSRKAMAWAKANPGVLYLQNEMNENFDPDINTGAYDDNNITDEFLWANTELAISTNDPQFMGEFAKIHELKELTIPTWGNVSSLCLYSFLGLYNGMSEHPQDTDAKVRERYLKTADSFIQATLPTIPTSCYNSPYGNTASDFCWGSNAESCCGKGIALLYLYRLTNDKKYLDAALQTADYLLGRNATGYCYVTGFGNYSPKHPHQRLSAADGIDEPLPGFLVGGPNAGKQDSQYCKSYTSDQPDECYTDDETSYASNEIAINWNASLVAFIGWLDAELR